MSKPETKIQLRRFVVYAVRNNSAGTVWVKVGSAVENRDASMNVYLDALPIDGKLHLRPPGPPAVDQAETERLRAALGIETAADLEALERAQQERK